LAAYIPEQSVVPDPILDDLGLKGRLHGSKKNRVKAIRMRGALSQGLLYPARDGWSHGQNVTDELGITKFRAKVPKPMAGNMWRAGPERTYGYYINNIKKHPNLIKEGELVEITEKIHGTFCCIGYMPKRLEHPEFGRWVVFSKGIGSRHLALRHNDPQNAENIYIKVFNQVKDKIQIVVESANEIREIDYPVFIMGEVFGDGVQDLKYGASLEFRVFDVYAFGSFMSRELLREFCVEIGIPMVPVLYYGSFSRETLGELTKGQTTINGAKHIREGVVIRPLIERDDPRIGRVILKSVSEAYLTRKGGTEYN
jgi:RNA ligase (TIGR02306 family)